MKAVIYSRFSTDKQNDRSVDQQEFACKKFAEQRGYSIVKTYSDEAKSGRNDRRPELQQMLSDAKKRLFDVIICFDSSRFHRNIYNYYAYKGQFDDYGVKIITLDNPSGNKIVEAVHTASADGDVDTIINNIRRSHLLNASEYKSTGGKPALGYDLDKDKRFIINETEAQIIRDIFEMKADGKGYGKIIDMCTQKGYKTKLGKPFGKNSLHDILVNVKYIGTYRYGKVNRTKTGRRNSHQTVPDDVVEKKCVIPPIIDKDTWNKVQAIMENDKRMPGKFKAKVDYLLRCKIYCHCGSMMVGKLRSKYLKDGTRKEYPLYTCNAKNRQKICQSKDLPKSHIEEKVSDYLFGTVLVRENVRRLKKQLDDELQQQLDIYELDREKYKSEFEDAKKCMENLMKVIKGGLSDDLLFAEYKKEKERYDIAKFNLSSVAPPATITEKQLEAIIGVAEGKEKTDDLINIVFDLFIKRVDITEDGEIKITSRFRLEKPTSTGSTFDGAEGRTRTGMSLHSVDFESTASTNFTTSAISL